MSTGHVELVSRSHHVDQDEPDAEGFVEWRYEYDLLELRASSGLEVTVRTYTDEPDQAALLRFELDGRSVDPGEVNDGHLDAVATFAAFLRLEGFDSVTRLGSQGYVEVCRAG